MVWFLQALSDEARFWGAFGFYAMLTMVCSANIIFNIRLSFRNSSIYCFMGWHLHIIFFQSLVLLFGLAKITFVKTGLSCGWIDWWFLDFYCGYFYASCMDLLLHINQLLWSSIIEVFIFMIFQLNRCFIVHTEDIL